MIKLEFFILIYVCIKKILELKIKYWNENIAFFIIIKIVFFYLYLNFFSTDYCFCILFIIFELIFFDSFFVFHHFFEFFFKKHIFFANHFILFYRTLANLLVQFSSTFNRFFKFKKKSKFVFSIILKIFFLFYDFFLFFKIFNILYFWKYYNIFSFFCISLFKNMLYKFPFLTSGLILFEFFKCSFWEFFPFFYLF